jgi:hypothetical protein
MGTTAQTSLTSLVYSHGSSDEDIRAINALIQIDQPPAGAANLGPAVATSGIAIQRFSKAGLLYVPRRGVLQIMQGDYVAVDSVSGFPILVSALAASTSPAWVHT